MPIGKLFSHGARMALGVLLAGPLAALGADADAPPAKRVSIDPLTGEVRPVELDDASGPATSAARNAAAARSVAPARGAGLLRLQGGEVVSPTGVRGMRTTVEQLNFTRAVRAADGSLQTTCTVGESAADHARHAPSPQPVVRRQAAMTQGGGDVE